MKTKAKSVPKQPRRRLPKTRATKQPADVESSLPSWVIGSYDGPSDGRLSLREGYVDSK